MLRLRKSWDILKVFNRPLPLKKINKHNLDRLDGEETVTLVKFSELAQHIVPIVKTDKSLRICGNYKVTEIEFQITSILKKNYCILKKEKSVT